MEQPIRLRTWHQGVERDAPGLGRALRLRWHPQLRPLASGTAEGEAAAGVWLGAACVAGEQG